MRSTNVAQSPLRAVLPVSIGTAFSLAGDSLLYTVLPTHAAEAGVALASVGILLSANRWIRLPLNPIAGAWIGRSRRRLFFVPALLIGALSTAVYSLNIGFVPFLVARLFWGLAWVGIWVTGNTIVLDASHSENRGHWVGIYQVSFFLGTAGGAVVGGLLTDLLGYRSAMAVNAVITTVGACVVLFFLPETREWSQQPIVELDPQESTSELAPEPEPAKDKLPVVMQRGQILSAALLLAANRIAVAGMLSVTLGLFIQQQLGEGVVINGRTVGIATLTGMGLGLTTLISAVSAPISGRVSDGLGRWRTAAIFLVPGIGGFFWLQYGTPLAMIGSLVAVAIASGSNTSLPTAIIGDASPPHTRSRWLGAMYTAGDLASAIGPPFVFWLLPLANIEVVYIIAGLIFTVVWLITLYWGRKPPVGQLAPKITI